MNTVRYHGEFPPAYLHWEQIIPLLGEARDMVARYDSMLKIIPNKEILLSPLTRQEAVMSSRIEGTQATIVDVLQIEAQSDADTLSEQRRHEAQEVINYSDAMLGAIEDLKKSPICTRVILKAHATLLSGVRGHGKARGRYRNKPVWIGKDGVIYYAPPPADQVPNLMVRWEKYINDEAQDKLVQLALMHVEFEAIHPFEDGNGRLGRMLIPLFMSQIKLLEAPAFYISAYLEAHRAEYYERLRAVSRDNDWTGWCKFFLQAIHNQAQENLKTVERVINLYNSLKERIPDLTHSQYGITILDAIFEQPVFRLSKFVEGLKIHDYSVRRIVKVLEQQKILKTFTKASGRKSAVMVFPEMLNIANGEDVF